MKTLFKQVKRGEKKNRNDSYFNPRLKERIYYHPVSVKESEVEAYLKKGYSTKLPEWSDTIEGVATNVTDNASKKPAAESAAPTVN